MVNYKSRVFVKIVDKSPFLTYTMDNYLLCRTYLQHTHFIALTVAQYMYIGLNVE